MSTRNRFCILGVILRGGLATANTLVSPVGRPVGRLRPSHQAESPGAGSRGQNASLLEWFVSGLVGAQ
jgi:hypothetical protein